MSQCKKDVVKEVMVRVGMDILGISELTQMGIKENEVKVLVTQSCLTLFDSMDYSPPGSSAHGILQTGILEWVAIPFSRGSSQPRNQTQVSSIAGSWPQKGYFMW